MAKTTDRVGSSMSNKQVAYAATSGHQITFNLAHGYEPVEGYVVGADDYHWMVACVEDGDINKVIVSKGNTVSLVLSPAPTLSDEPTNIQVAISEIGRGFWLYCDKTYFGKTEPASKKETHDTPELR